MIRLDREVDLVSPLVTPLTYEGLMDEILGIVSNTVRVDPSSLGEDFQRDTTFNMTLPNAAGNRF